MRPIQKLVLPKICTTWPDEKIVWANTMVVTANDTMVGIGWFLSCNGWEACPLRQTTQWLWPKCAITTTAVPIVVSEYDTWEALLSPPKKIYKGFKKSCTRDLTGGARSLMPRRCYNENFSRSERRVTNLGRRRKKKKGNPFRKSP